MEEKYQSSEPIVLASTEELMTKKFVVAFAKKMTKLGKSRQGSTDWLAEKLEIARKRGVMRADGRPFHLYDGVIDDAYGHEITCSWNSAVKKFVVRAPKRNPRWSLLLRFLLWDCAFKAAGDPIIVKEQEGA